MCFGVDLIFFARSVVLICYCVFFAKIAGPDFYRLGEFFVVVVSFSHSLRLCEHTGGFSTNSLCVLFLFFLLFC